MSLQKVELKVPAIGQAALQVKGYVTSIDILLGLGYLSPTHLKEWRFGEIDILEMAIQANSNKIYFAMEVFRKWATEIHLIPNYTAYVIHGRNGARQTLKFSKSGDPAIEKNYCTHYTSPDLSQKKRNAITKNHEKAPEHAVFITVSETACNKCLKQIPKGAFLDKEKDQVYCMSCSEYGEMAFLPSGDPLLTRRAKKYSSQSCIVLKFSRTRGRYERQGILIEEEALNKAQQEIDQES
ncbi:MAG: hypothetical protein LLF94_10925 [Chlamydiales bacterium]|nr:hypothetical protein [Chlamydiales bacterium]